jgi:ABC-2 type transport system permease protein
VTGWQTLFYKEVLRFWKVRFPDGGCAGAHRHAVPADLRPCAGRPVKVYDTVSYTAFLVPGLVMMSVLQNAFANSSSSLIQSKIMGSLVFVLLTPVALELVCAYVGLRSCAAWRWARVCLW